MVCYRYSSIIIPFWHFPICSHWLCGKTDYNAFKKIQNRFLAAQWSLLIIKLFFMISTSEGDRQSVLRVGLSEIRHRKLTFPSANFIHSLSDRRFEGSSFMRSLNLCVPPRHSSLTGGLPNSRNGLFKQFRFPKFDLKVIEVTHWSESGPDRLSATSVIGKQSLHHRS
jgi:hypothetical protein